MELLDNIRIVLIKPLYGGNLGAICRAMMNMGISDLALVNPNPDLEWEEAEKMAMHARSILANRQDFPSASAAVADCGLVAATSARTGFYRDHSQSPRETAPCLLQAAAHQPAALMFGPEDKGMDNDDLALATHI